MPNSERNRREKDEIIDSGYKKDPHHVLQDYGLPQKINPRLAQNRTPPVPLQQREGVVLRGE